MSSSDSLQHIRDAMKDKVVDTFDVGTVITFTSGGKYTYAVIKTAVGWISTARFDNGHVPQTMGFQRLLDLLAKPDITDVKIATTDKFETPSRPVGVTQASRGGLAPARGVRT